MQMGDLAILIESWEQVGRVQRQLADNERDTGLRASLIAASNVWMTAADDLRKHMENHK